MINPIRLANEWRDSLALTTLLAGTAAFGDVALHAALSIIFWREIARDHTWMRTPPSQIVGGPRLPDRLDVACAAYAIAVVVGFIQTFVGRCSPWVFGVWVLCAGLTWFRAWAHDRTPGGLVRGYLAAWDWPRKRGGPTETQKLADAVDRLSGATAGGRA